MEMLISSKVELEKRAGWGATHLISILDIGHTIQTPSWIKIGHHFRFYFDDISYGEPDEGGNGPTREHVRLLLELGKELTTQHKLIKLIVQCAGGISRSPAVAYCLLCQYLGVGKEQLALTEVENASFDIWPNDAIIYHGDCLLQRNGRMIAAVKNWKKMYNASLEKELK